MKTEIYLLILLKYLTVLKLGDNYTSSSKSFDNYDLVSASNANGTFTSTTQTVTLYVYRRKDAGNVIAHYVNTGLPIEKVMKYLTEQRKLGLPYTTDAKTIPGYSYIWYRK